ncbi:MAG: 4-(cytidine 5'-diphospho)-2-C-methyl-D-erythritol kinase [Planctomycetota bacterium]
MNLKIGSTDDPASASISLLAPAKVNLFLDVKGKRADGFHEIETVMCPISLCDEIVVSRLERPEIELHLAVNKETAADRFAGTQEADPAWQIPADSSNLVVRAAEAVQESLLETGRLRVPAGIRIDMHKSIPAQAGLAGGSSNAAAVVVACLCLWSKWDRHLATEICRSLGSDIAFFLGDEEQIGLGLATGRGEQCVQVPSRPQLDFLLTHPRQGCSTGQIYSLFQPSNTERNSKKLLAACQTCEARQFEKIGAELFNALQSPATQTCEWIDLQLDLFQKAGLMYNLMTGSGSACFALVEDASNFDFGAFEQNAVQLGVPRVFSASSWYQPSIERQLLALEDNQD